MDDIDPLNSHNLGFHSQTEAGPKKHKKRSVLLL